MIIQTLDSRNIVSDRYVSTHLNYNTYILLYDTPIDQPLSRFEIYSNVTIRVNFITGHRFVGG